MKFVFTIAIGAILVLGNFACVPNKPKKVYLEYGCRMTIPTPAILGEPFTSHQSLSFESKGKNYHMQAQVEFENQKLTIVGLNTAFVTMFSLDQIENRIEYAPSIKTPIKPKLILGFYYAIFCPLEKLKNLFSKNVTCTETTYENTRIRKIFIGKKEIYHIQYLPFKNGTKIIFSNLKRKLTFTLIEDYKTKL